MAADDNSKNLSRRQFLSQGSLLGAAAMVPTPVERLLEMMTRSFISQAEAAAVGAVGPRNYVSILMAGAPSRYVFDHWMRTNASDPQLEFNPMVATSYVNSGGRAGGVQYSTFNYNNTLVPQMFAHSVAKSSGGKRPLTDYLNNMLVIRGYASGLDGHQFNALLQQAPVGGISSLSGLAADYSSKTFEAIQWPDRATYRTYASSKSKALNILSGSQPVSNLLLGFGGPGAGREKARNLKDRHQEAFDLAQERLKAYVKSDQIGSETMSKNLGNAAELMKKGIGNIDGYWNSALARYKAVIEASIRESGLIGISDIPLISTQDGTWRVHVASGNRGLVVSANSDLRSSISTMTAPGFLAEGLALTEYVLKENLVSSVDLMCGNYDNLTLVEAGLGAAVHTMITDMHETGAMTSVLLNSAYYRGLCAGLLELSDQLKATTVNGVSVWSETVIQIISDFGRRARTDGSGSDHGFDQMVTSVFSGAIQGGPFVVGNIYKKGPGGGYLGTQGYAAPIEGYTQKLSTPVMAASTVAALMRVERNPYTNLAAPLVSLDSGTLKVAHTAKIVEG